MKLLHTRCRGVVNACNWTSRAVSEKKRTNNKKRAQHFLLAAAAAEHLLSSPMRGRQDVAKPVNRARRQHFKVAASIYIVLLLDQSARHIMQLRNIYSLCLMARQRMCLWVCVHLVMVYFVCWSGGLALTHTHTHTYTRMTNQMTTHGAKKMQCAPVRN